MKNIYNNKILSSNKYKLFLYLFLFWSLAVAQPLMSVFGKQPEFLIAHEIRGLNLIFITLLLNILIPFLIWLFLVFLGLVSKNLKEWITRLVLVVLLILFVLPFVNSLSNYLAFSSALLTSLFVVYVLVKFEIIKTFVFWFSPMSLLLLLNFLLFSPASQLIKSQASNLLGAELIKPGPIFVIVVDEFPLISILKSKEEIDKSRFPTFAKLAQTATWYPNAFAISNSTTIVLPSLLSGKEPLKKNQKLATYDNFPINLFTQFSKTHDMHVVENTSRLCPISLCNSVINNPYRLLVEDSYISYLHLIYPKKLKKRLPPINDRWVGFMREQKNHDDKVGSFSERLAVFNSFIDSIESYGDKTVHFLHTLIPHAPWKILPDLSLYGFYENEGIPGEFDTAESKSRHGISHMWSNDSWATQLGWRKHLLQVGAADTLVNKAINKIKSLGLYDEATIIIVSDHGSAFIPGMSRRFAHGENIPDIVSIPLFIKYPKQEEGKVDYRFASNLDIFPTILDVYSIDTQTFDLNGLSLIGKNKRQEPHDIFQEDHIMTSIPDNYQSLLIKSIETKNKLFPIEGWKGIYQTPDTSDFYNKNVDTLNINTTLSDSIFLYNENLFKEFNNNSNYIPSYYRIKVKKELKVNEVLVALNGKVVSHCYMFTHEKNDCAGLIDPAIFMKLGEQNKLNFRYFSVLNKENKKYLVNELLAVKLVSAKIEVQDGLEVLNFGTGKNIPVSHGQPYGDATLLLVDNNSSYKIDGWAGNTITGEVAQKIYVFINGQLFAETTFKVPKNYLKKVYGFDDLINSGFHINIPADQFPNIENNEIRVFISGNGDFVTEANYHSDKIQRNLFRAFNKDTNRKIPVNKAKILAKQIENNDAIKTINAESIDAFMENFKNISTGDWFTINKHSRWVGASTSVIVPVTDNSVSLTLSIKAKPLLYPNELDKQILIITANDKLVKNIEYTEHSSHDVTIDLSPEDKLSPVIITMKMPNAAVPADYVDSKDKRKLSLLVTDFRINVNNEKQ